MPTAPRRTVSVQDIELALRDLGSHAHVSNIKDKVEDLYGGIPANYASDYTFRNTIQAIINKHRRGSPSFVGHEIFRRTARGEYDLVDTAPLLDDDNALTGETSFLEGQSTQNWIVRYERDAELRPTAIKIHGTICQGCGFDFERKYGAIGVGFIEVHHTKPVSSLGGSVQVDPRTDLVVLCSNCHSIVHRRRPVPLSIDELKTAIFQTAK